MKMKKILVAISTMFLVVILAFAFSGCDKSGDIVKAFEDADYTVTEVSADNDIAKRIMKEAGLTDEQVENVSEYKIYLCTANGIIAAFTSSGVVLKFPSSGELKDFLTVEDGEGNKKTDAYDTAKKEERINGNCLYFGMPAGKEIFKNA